MYYVKNVLVLSLDALPIDPIEKNYVREVRDAIFSVVYPTPFKSRVLLVAVSKVRFDFSLSLPLHCTAIPLPLSLGCPGRQDVRAQVAAD